MPGRQDGINEISDLDLGYSRLFRSILIPNAVPVDPCGVLLYKPRPFRVHR